jgi:hypothetical protein
MIKVDQYESFTSEETKFVKDWFEQHHIPFDTVFQEGNPGFLDAPDLLDLHLIEDKTDLRRYLKECLDIRGPESDEDLFGFTDHDNHNIILKMNNNGSIFFRYLTPSSTQDFTSLPFAMEFYRPN